MGPSARPARRAGLLPVPGRLPLVPCVELKPSPTLTDGFPVMARRWRGASTPSTRCPAAVDGLERHRTLVLTEQTNNTGRPRAGRCSTASPPQAARGAPRRPAAPRCARRALHNRRASASSRASATSAWRSSARPRATSSIRLYAPPPDDGSGRRTKAAWGPCWQKHDPTPLASCVHTLGQLARYY